MALRLRQMELAAKTMHGPVLKIRQLSEHAQNHVTYLKSLTAICLFTIQLLWRYDNVQGRLLLAPLMLKLFFGRKFLSTV